MQTNSNRQTRPMLVRPGDLVKVKPDIEAVTRRAAEGFRSALVKFRDRMNDLADAAHGDLLAANGDARSGWRAAVATSRAITTILSSYIKANNFQGALDYTNGAKFRGQMADMLSTMYSGTRGQQAFARDVDQAALTLINARDRAISALNTYARIKSITRDGIGQSQAQAQGRPAQAKSQSSGGIGR